MSQTTTNYSPRVTYAQTVESYRNFLPFVTAQRLRQLADKSERAYRRWKASKNPPITSHLILALYGIRAYRKIARERERSR